MRASRPGCSSTSSARCPDRRLSLELRAAEQDVELVAGNATFHIRTLRAEDFPPLPEPGGDTEVSVPAEAFVDTVARVQRSASRDETRPVLTGILVSASGDELRMVATDSYRLCVKETKLEAALEGSFEANVPARALQELARIAQAAEEAETLQHRRAARTRSSSRWRASSCPRGSSRASSRTTASSCPSPSSTS